jgi:tetratricopeptide (TPR) repeat protein
MMLRTKRIAFLFAVATAAFIFAGQFHPAFADEQGPAIEHPYDTEGKKDIDAGEYELAEAYFNTLLEKKENAQKPEVILTLCRLYSLTGRYEEVVKTVDDAAGRGVKSGRIDLMKAEALYRMGKNQEAGALFENVAKQNPELHKAQLDLAKFYHESGKLEEAKAILGKLTDLDPAAYPNNPETLYVIGEAARMSNNYGMANDVLLTAYTVDPGYEEPYVARSRLFVDLFDINYPYTTILEKLFLANRRSPMGHVLKGWCLFYDFDTPRHFELAMGEVNFALKYNPNLIEALDLAAYIFSFTEQYDRAQEYIDRALKVNPNSLSTLAQQGFLCYITGQDEKYSEVEKKVLALDPKCAEFYFVIGNTMDKKYGFKYSVEFCRKAVELDPDFDLAYPVLARNLLFIGREDEGMKVLEKCWEGAGSYDPRIKNLRMVMDHVLNVEERIMTERRTKHFIIRIPREEEPLLGPYMEDLLETEWADLGAKYHYEPKEWPILIECFRDPEYFSARTTAVPGLGYATGASFGTFITALTPDAMHIKTDRVDTYLSAWGQVVYHEFMHIISIQRTNSRIARWLTEGMSEMEQKLKVPAWGREEVMDPMFAQRLRAEGIIPIEQLDTAFLDLRTMQPAYYQAYLVCQYIRQKYGYEKFGAMMDEYAKRRQTTESVIQTCFGMSAKEFDKQFAAWCAEQYKDYGLPPQYTQADLDNMLKQLDKRKNWRNAALHMEIARAYFQLGKKAEFEEYADKALQLDNPDDPACGDIYTLRGIVKIGTPMSPGFNEALPLFLKAMNSKPRDTFTLSMGLARCYEGMNDMVNAEKYYLLAKKACPTFVGPGSAVISLMAFYDRQKKKDEVVKLKEEMVSYADIDFGTRADLLKHYLDVGDDAKAAEMILEMIYVDPKYEVDHLEASEIFKRLGWLDKVGTEYEVMNVLAVKSQPDVYLTEAAKNFFEAGWIDRAKDLIIKALQANGSYQAALDLKKKIEEKVGAFEIPAPPAPEPKSPTATEAAPEPKPPSAPEAGPQAPTKPATKQATEPAAGPGPTEPKPAPEPAPEPKPNPEPAPAPAPAPAPGP